MANKDTFKLKKKRKKRDPNEIVGLRKGPWKKDVDKIGLPELANYEALKDHKTGGLLEEVRIKLEKLDKKYSHLKPSKRTGIYPTTLSEWLAFTKGSRPVRGHKTSLKSMGLKGQPKPELAKPRKKAKKKSTNTSNYHNTGELPVMIIRGNPKLGVRTGASELSKLVKATKKKKKSSTKKR